MIDVHCHLNFNAFKDDYDEVIKRALAKGITRIINVGTKLDTSEQAVELAEQYDELYAIVGIHPHHADKLSIGYRGDEVEFRTEKDFSAPPLHQNHREEKWLMKLEKFANHPKVLAIGEIGMDFYSYKSNGIVDPDVQEEVFIEQIKLAHKLKLPLQIHNRHAGERVIEILQMHRHLLQKHPGMFHCFAGSKEVLGNALDLGFAIGFDGNITYPGLAPGETVSLAELATLTPLDRIVVETDSPYLTPMPHRGTRNEPSYAIIVAEYLAKLKGVSFETFKKETTRNAYLIFPKLK